MPPALDLGRFQSARINIERMLLENAVPYPVERALLTSGMVIFASSRALLWQTPVETLELKVAAGARAIYFLAGVTRPSAQKRFLFDEFAAFRRPNIF